MDAGRIVVQGDPKKVLGDRELMKQYGLETPYSLCL
jgi:ABC-type hemin transport system ATPase subunit